METLKHKDMALQKATQRMAERQQAVLPSNFAYVTLRKVEAERRRIEHRNKVITLASIIAVVLLGIGALIYTCGKTLLGLFTSLPAIEGKGYMLVPMLVCLTFFAALNTYLQKRFKTM